MNLKEYFKRLGCDYFDEQYKSYKIIDFDGKDVTIIGADCGTTILYARINGANRIIAYESDETKRKIWEMVCMRFLICENVEWRGEWKGEKVTTPILIMDCEGCEEKLEKSMLDEVEQYCIAVHEWTGKKQILEEWFKDDIITYVTPDQKEKIFCKTRK